MNVIVAPPFVHIVIATHALQYTLYCTITVMLLLNLRIEYMHVEFGNK
jgi:hypothetical protein